jgi:hypothetical protein
MDSRTQWVGTWALALAPLLERARASFGPMKGDFGPL